MEEHSFTSEKEIKVKDREKADDTQTKEYKPKWYFSYPVLIALYVFCFPISFILSLLRLRQYKEQKKGYRFRSFLAVGVNLVVIFFIAYTAIVSAKWERDYDKCIKNGDYNQAKSLLDEHYEDSMTEQGINRYLEVFELSDNYGDFDRVVLSYYHGLEDKTRFDENIISKIEEVNDHLNEDQRKVVDGIRQGIEQAQIRKEEEESIAIVESESKKAEEESRAIAEKEKEQTQEVLVESTVNPEQNTSEAVDIDVLKQAIDEYLDSPDNKKKNLKVIKEYDKDLVMSELSKIILDATSSDLSTFVRVRECKRLYEEAFHESCPKLDKNSELAEQLSDLYNEQENLKSLYPFNFEDGVTGYQLADVYVTNRIEDKDAETITGKISQAIESHNAKQWKYYDSKNDSYWAANNVEYNELWGELPGEESYVILTNQTSPFSKPGVYKIAYYSDGRTITTVSDRGFEAETPVLYLINEIQLLADWDTYKESKSKSENLLVEIKKLNGFKGASLNKSDESSNTESEVATTDSEMGYILPDSNSRYLTETDLQGLDQAALRLARNEIYARHGRAFETEDLNNYFSQQPWYNGYLSADEFDDAVFNEYEKANLELIQSIEGLSAGSTIETPDILNTQWAMTPNEEYSFIIKGDSLDAADVYVIETKNPDNIQYHGYVRDVTATETADLYIGFGFGRSNEFAIVWNDLENIDFPKLEALNDYLKEFEGDYHYYGTVN